MKQLLKINHPEHGTIPLGVYDDTTNGIVRRVYRNKHLHNLTNSYMYYKEAIPYFKKLGVKDIILQEADTGNYLCSTLEQWESDGKAWRDQIALSVNNFFLIKS